jgi:hypothetical protein
MKIKATPERETEIAETETIFVQHEDEATLMPLNAVTSTGVEKETELSASAVVLSENQLERVESMLQNLNAMRGGISLNAKYREFDAVGETIRGVFLGMKTIVKGKEHIEAVTWIDSGKQLWLNAGKILVNQLRDLPKGTPVEITYTQKLKVEMGYAKEFEVRPLY